MSSEFILNALWHGRRWRLRMRARPWKRCRLVSYGIILRLYCACCRTRSPRSHITTCDLSAIKSEVPMRSVKGIKEKYLACGRKFSGLPARPIERVCSRLPFREPGRDRQWRSALAFLHYRNTFVEVKRGGGIIAGI